ncbi:putative exported protein [hydrothermal vent metagenome]|uniref:Putative exported protein n=1 Tax=hydrothermal vent metagenome TaxID=652676 RepID=A0A1W1CFY4_9ZZZZ
MLKKISKYIFYSFVAYLLIGFFILPFFLKPQLVTIIQNQTKTKASIAALSFNPLLFSVKISGLKLTDLQNKALFSFDLLRINVNPSSLLYGALKIKEFSLIAPRVSVVYNKDKSINLLNLLKPQKNKHQENKTKISNTFLPRIIIESIKLENGKINYTDYTRKQIFQFSLENIGFSLKDFDTKNITQENAEVHLYSKLGDGGFVDVKSKILNVRPFKTEGTLSFAASKLYTEWKYMQDVLKLEVADGKISFYTKYAFNLGDLNATKIEDLNLSVKNLRIKPKAKDHDILNLKNLYVQNAMILPMQQKVNIKKAGVYGLRLKAQRSADGVLDWLEYLKTETTDVNTTDKSVVRKSKLVKPWDVRLNSLALEKISLLFRDKAVEPNVATKVNELNVYAHDITLAGKKPFTYQIEADINKNTLCDINGTLAHKSIALMSNIECQDIDIAHYRPYIDQAAHASLKKYDIALDRAFLDFKAALRVDENNTSMALLVNDANVSLKKLLVRKKSTNEQLLRWRDFTIKGVQLSTAKKELFIADVALNKMLANIVRQNSGILNVADIVAVKNSKKKKRADKQVKPTEAYSVKVAQIELNDAQIKFLDKNLTQAQKHTLDKINIQVNDFDIKKRSWLHYKASIRVNKSGILRANGKLRHTPLKQSGEISVQNIALKALTPYLQERSYISIDDGRFSFKVKESYLPSKHYPDLRMHGSVALDSLFVTNTKDANSSLFSLNELRVKPFTLELFPNRLYVDSVDIDSFYVSAKIDENKSLNFAQLMKEKKSKPVQQQSQKKQEPFAVKIAKVNVKNGSAEFRDFSLPIKFKTNIHDLNGALYALSNSPGDTTYVNMSGEVDKYGSTKLKGSVDSFNPKEFTDMQFDFKNLDLHSMSGYSASFAGYEIDSGKLYLNLGYNILHAKLHATNNIMIKKIKLGRELEGENINHLPLGFVIGLLEDNEGIIDIDMPIEGDVDKPDFKYGALVFKTLGNLIAKAVTSPFRFLGSMMGLDGEDLEFIAFEFGKSDITPPQREKLDKIAKLMQKRPKIALKIDAVYDDKNDLKALKLEKLVAMVMKQSGDENVKNAKNSLNIDVLENVYAQLRNDDRLDALKTKLHKEYEKKDAFNRAYQNALIELCTEIQPVEKKALEALAKERANKIEAYLVEEKSLAAKRIVIANTIKQNDADDATVHSGLTITVSDSDK